MKNEPDFKDTNMSLIDGLRFYHEHCNFSHSKAYALEWIKQHLPDEFDRLKDAKEHLFSNRGFVCRMIKMGLKVSDDQKRDLLKFFIGMRTDAAPKESANKESNRKKMPEKVNTVIFQLEDIVDQILSDVEPSLLVVPTEKAQLSEARAWIEKQIVDAQEQVDKHRAILEQLQAAYEKCGGAKVPTARRVHKDTKADLAAEKAAAVKTVKYKKKDESLGIESLSPARIVGAKEVLVYNTKRRQMARFVAAPGQVLTVSRSSVRNFDPDKSKCKTIRKPRDLFAVKDIWKAFEATKTTEQSARTLISEDCLIISVK